MLFIILSSCLSVFPLVCLSVSLSLSISHLYTSFVVHSLFLRLSIVADRPIFHLVWLLLCLPLLLFICLFAYLSCLPVLCPLSVLCHYASICQRKSFNMTFIWRFVCLSSLSFIYLLFFLSACLFSPPSLWHPSVCLSTNHSVPCLTSPSFVCPHITAVCLSVCLPHALPLPSAAVHSSSTLLSVGASHSISSDGRSGERRRNRLVWRGYPVTEDEWAEEREREKDGEWKGVRSGGERREL